MPKQEKLTEQIYSLDGFKKGDLVRHKADKHEYVVTYADSRTVIITRTHKVIFAIEYEKIIKASQ